jgi:hypothetical protein
MRIRLNFKTIELLFQFSPCGLYHKSFRIIIYDRNNSMILIYDLTYSDHYYKTINYIG